MTKLKENSFLAVSIILSNILIAPLSNAQSPSSNHVVSSLPLATESSWYDDGAKKVLEASRRSYNNDPGSAKNIILFIGDGMSIATITAARIYAGQQLGLNGEEYQLSFENFPWTGLSKTYNTNQQTPDSAGTMTAIMTGVKTKTGFIGIDSQAQLSDCESYLNSDQPNLMTALELAEIAGKATGIVSTTRITHATPAATYAKAPSRLWESSSDLNAETKALGCTDIAQQLIEFEHNLEARVNNGKNHSNINGIDVVFGGGRAQFFGADPASLTGFAETKNEGKRDDGRNLIAEWQKAGGTYVMDQAGFSSLNNNTTGAVLGLFNKTNMLFEIGRHEDLAGEPSLTEMTTKAIELLERDNDGFFLMVEAGRIDHAHHFNNAFNALNETAELSRAVAAAVNMTDANETLIIVTADHSHVMTMAGYPTRGNPILGKVIENDLKGNPRSEHALDKEGAPYTTLTYSNGLGFAQYGEETDGEFISSTNRPEIGRADLNHVDTQTPGYHQEALIPLLLETHSGEDVAIYGSGPGAHLLSGTMEQNVIFHVMNFAGDLENSAIKALE